VIHDLDHAQRAMAKELDQIHPFQATYA